LDKKQLQDHGARLNYFGRLGLYYHSLGNRCGTGSLQQPVPLYLTDADTAIGLYCLIRMPAQGRDPDTACAAACKMVEP